MTNLAETESASTGALARDKETDHIHSDGNVRRMHVDDDMSLNDPIDTDWVQGDNREKALDLGQISSGEPPIV